jgi:prefoldin subunit 5
MQSEKEIGEFEREIKELSKKINEIEKSINKIKNLKDEQNAIINYEIERLNNIFNFINDK